MKNVAAVMTATRQLELREVDMPSLGPQDVLIENEYVGICGSDMLYFEHGRIAANIVKPPFILGHEAAGTVREVGSGVTGIRPGDRVAIEPGVPCGHCRFCRIGRYNICKSLTFRGTPPVNGLYQKYVTHPAEWVHPLPEGLGTLGGALIEPLAVGVHAARLARIGFEDTVLILGGGCIGLMTLLAAKQYGARQVIVADLFEKRLAKARELGADDAIDAASLNTEEAVMELTRGEGADVVFETAGNPVTAYQAVKLVGRGGVVVQTGTLPKDLNYNVRTMEIHEAELKLVWRYCNDFPTAIQIAERNQAALTSLVTDVYDLKDIQQAFLHAINEKQAAIKTVIRF